MIRWPWRRPQHVTLVVDDGPSEAMPELVARLEAAGHRAVLFVLGGNLAGREAVAVDAVRRGFALGNHSFSHPRFSDIDATAARVEIEETERLIDVVYRSAQVRRPGRWFRFPYLDAGGARAAEFQHLLGALGFERPAAVTARAAAADLSRHDWTTTLDTRDWSLPEDADVRRAVSRARPGDVIEIHDKVATVPRYVAALCEELAVLSLHAVVPAARR